MNKMIGAAVLALVPVVAGAAQPLAYVPLPESCRLLDTRTTGTPLEPGVVLPVDVMGPCAIPFEAQAVAANITATNTTGEGFLALPRPVGRPSAAPAPTTSALNYTGPDQTVANAALITLGQPREHWGGVFWIVAGVSGADVIVDVSGYYVPLP